MEATLLNVEMELREEVRVQDLITNQLSVQGNTLIGDVVRVFEENPDIDGLAVLDGRHIGFVSRPRLLSQIGSKFGYALYERKEIRMLMEKDPLVVDAGSDPVLVIGKATQRVAQKIYDDIIVTRMDDFLGLVSLRSLMVHNKEILGKSMAQVALMNEKANKLEQLNQVQAEFVANMTHELRAPLNSIVGVGRLLMMDPRLLEDHRGAIDILLGKGTELMGLINNILDFHKIGAGEMKPILETADVAILIEDLGRATEVLLKGKPVEFYVEFVNLPENFVTDAVFVRRILTNLLSNAAKFTDQGRIVLKAEGARDHIFIHVIDTGPGISNDDLPNLFRKYTQTESTKTKRHGGTGLGLMIARNLAEAIQGSISVQSEAGKGSHFTLCLKNLAPRLLLTN